MYKSLRYEKKNYINSIKYILSLACKNNTGIYLDSFLQSEITNFMFSYKDLKKYILKFNSKFNFDNRCLDYYSSRNVKSAKKYKRQKYKRQYTKTRISREYQFGRY